jgi:hypothetical protein
MPLVLLSKPVGASGNRVTAEMRISIQAAAKMKSFMGSTYCTTEERKKAF